MEWTVGFPVGARLFERYIFANYLHNIQSVFDGLGVGHIIYSVGLQRTLPDVILLNQPYHDLTKNINLKKQRPLPLPYGNNRGVKLTPY